MDKLTNEQRAVLVEYVQTAEALDAVINRGEAMGLRFSFHYTTSKDPDRLQEFAATLAGDDPAGDEIMAVIRGTLDQLQRPSYLTTENGREALIVPRTGE